MISAAAFLKASEAAARLGISTKALRLYEQRGLLTPIRSAAGWRAYGAYEMSRAAEIVGLRALGLSLAEIGRVLEGQLQGLEPALAAQEALLETRLRELAAMTGKIRGLRGDLARDQAPAIGEMIRLTAPAGAAPIEFDLPWPWGGECFALGDIRRLNHITGPLGSGKTRLLMRLAETLPGAAFLGLERLADDCAAAQARLDADPALKSRVDRTLAWLVEDGATASTALTALLAGLEAEEPAVLVVDMLEQGLDEATQQALMAHLRRQRPDPMRPLFFLTRSSTILDLDSVGPDETILFCPANHSPPIHVMPYRGAPGYEALASCLAPPAVRARIAAVPAGG
jgi:DNA-binding transcriptional MerR regulator